VLVVAERLRLNGTEQQVGVSLTRLNLPVLPIELWLYLILAAMPRSGWIFNEITDVVTKDRNFKAGEASSFNPED
jgi:hypothetical protein